jgi:hypothetical protein
MWRKTVALAALAALLAAPAGATRSGGVRVAHHGQGAYIGGPMGTYVIALLVSSPSLAQIRFDMWTTCYPSYETVNGKAVKLTPAQQKSMSSASGLPVPIPKVHLSPNGTFHGSETLPGPNGASATISGQINGTHASGTFSATGIRNSGNRCDDVHQAWNATYDSGAAPDPTLFRP